MILPQERVDFSPGQGRIPSVDQCRGFCILAMIGGNFAGKFAFMPWILTHHPYGLSIAELFGPVFFFMVGFGYRLSFLRRIKERGRNAARQYALRRYTLIMLLGFIAHMDHLWDALTHIGMAGLLILPFMDKKWPTRAAVGLIFLALFQLAFLYTEYGNWLMDRAYSLNGGPLAALSWGFIILCGTIAYDIWASYSPRGASLRMLGWAAALALAGWLLSLPWPGIKEAWPFTRYGMTAPYPMVATGFALIMFLCFYLACDRYALRLPFVSPIGANPLLMYAIMGAFIGLSKLAIRVYGEPGFYAALAGYVGICLVCYGVASFLYRKNVSIRIS